MLKKSDTFKFLIKEQQQIFFIRFSVRLLTGSFFYSTRSSNAQRLNQEQTYPVLYLVLFYKVSICFLIFSGQDHRAVFPGYLSSFSDLFQPCAEGQGLHGAGSMEKAGEGKVQDLMIYFQVHLN